MERDWAITTLCICYMKQPIYSMTLIMPYMPWLKRRQDAI